MGVGGEHADDVDVSILRALLCAATGLRAGPQIIRTMDTKVKFCTAFLELPRLEKNLLLKINFLLKKSHYSEQ